LIVVDTHVVVWRVSGSRRISARAKRTIKQSLRQGLAVASAISVLEIATSAAADLYSSRRSTNGSTTSGRCPTYGSSL